MKQRGSIAGWRPKRRRRNVNVEGTEKRHQEGRRGGKDKEKEAREQ